MNTQHRVALITGGSRGLGRVMALALLQAGHDVVLAATDAQALSETVTEAVGMSGQPGCVKAIQVDLAVPGEAERLADEAQAAFGHVDLLVNNAGISLNAVSLEYLSQPYRFWRSDRQVIERYFAINAVAPMVLANRLAPAMVARGWGRIIANTTSLDSMLRFPLYGGSKAALEAETAVMAQDLVGTGVTANVLVPGGGAASRMTDELGIPRALLIPDLVMANPIVFLASDASNGFNGRRILANRWQTNLPTQEAATRASDPIAWTGYGSPGQHPAMAAKKAEVTK